MTNLSNPRVDRQEHRHTRACHANDDRVVRVGKNPLDSRQHTWTCVLKESYAMACRLTSTETTWSNDPLHVWATPSESFT